MFHDDRVWRVIEVESAEGLAHLLTEATQTLCSAFVVAGHPDYLFLNDCQLGGSRSRGSSLCGRFAAHIPACPWPPCWAQARDRVRARAQEPGGL